MSFFHASSFGALAAGVVLATTALPASAELASATPLDTAQVHFVDAPFGDGSPLHVVAEIEWQGGKVAFIDETIGHVFGFGLLEQGNANLAAFHEQGASALEIFLALAPAGTEVPEVLYRAHEMARELDPDVPAEPRRLLAELPTGTAGSHGGGRAAEKLSYYTFQHDTNNCWGWGGVNSYNSLIGNEGSHSSSGMASNFRTWSGISWVLGQTSSNNYYDESAELGDQYYPTAFGNERALAMCVPYALVQPDENPWACAVEGGVYENTVDYRVWLRGENASSSWSAGPIQLDAYGQGLRYRSSSSQERKYTLEVRDYSEDSSICFERYEVFTRNRDIRSKPPGGLTGG